MKEYLRCASCGRLQAEDTLRKRLGCVCGSNRFRRHFPGITIWERVLVFIDQCFWRVL